MTTVYNRKTKEYEEIKHYGSKALTRVYSNKLITNIAMMCNYICKFNE